jgi:hypothetical protein
MTKTSLGRSLNGREARADQIFFHSSSLVTRVPRHAELSVAAAAGIVFTISDGFNKTVINA